MKTISLVTILSGTMILSANAQQITTETYHPEIPAEDTNNEKNTPLIQSAVIETPVEVFSPQFMTDLRQCNANYEVKDNTAVRILGLKEGRCRLTYANFELNVPLSLLGNIHSFDDLQTLLKNRDIAHYTYAPDYTYDGLIYAIDSCSRHTDYEGETEQLTDQYAIMERGIYSKYANKLCTVNLYNKLDVKGTITNYSVVCTLSDEIVNHLEDYITDLVSQFGEKRGFAANGHIMITPAQQNKQTHEADIAIMYYLQQNELCKKTINEPL